MSSQRGIARERALRRQLDDDGWSFLGDPKFLYRFWSKVDKTDGCWFWTGSTNSNGYGKIWTARPNRSPHSAHRVAYMLEHGSIAEELVIDHLCRRPLCVNPEHLELVPQSVNAIRDRSDLCSHGHDLDRVRSQTDPDGTVRRVRWCSTCDKQSKQKRVAAKRRGTQREHAVRDVLEADGWLVVRGAGSLGVADLVALHAGRKPRLVQVKSDDDSPYGHFGPGERGRLLDAAVQAGAEAWLAWWPPGRKRGLKWIHESDWPLDRRQLHAVGS